MHFIDQYVWLFKRFHRVRKLYETTMEKTVDGCSDDLEEFLYELRVALDGDSYDED